MTYSSSDNIVEKICKVAKTMGFALLVAAIVIFFTAFLDWEDFWDNLYSSFELASIGATAWLFGHFIPKIELNKNTTQQKEESEKERFEIDIDEEEDKIELENKKYWENDSDE